MLIDDTGMWFSQGGLAPQTDGKAAVFLDRDGVVIEDRGFLREADQVELIPGVADLVGILNRRQIPVIVVTNQSGIGRDMISWDEFCNVNNRMDALLLDQGGGHIDALLACAAHKEASGQYRVPRHSWRKPFPGMFFAARDRLGCDLAKSWMIGDRWTDIRAAKRGGLAGASYLSAKRPNGPNNLICGNFTLQLLPNLVNPQPILMQLAAHLGDEQS